jgi:hypothetical protein
MTDRITTVHSLLHRGPRPDLYELRLLERGFQRRLAELDARVDELLDLAGPPTDEQVAAVDVLCAAICELQELREEAHREAAHHVARHHARRSRTRRWA